jgi:hypothetical protein
MLWFQVLIVLVTVAWLLAARAYIREVNRGPKSGCSLPKLGWGNIHWPTGHEDEVVVVEPQVVESGVL